MTGPEVTAAMKAEEWEPDDEGHTPVYTPSTEHVKFAWLRYRGQPMVPAPEFDRWLDRHDREIQADARAAGYEAGYAAGQHDQRAQQAEREAMNARVQVNQRDDARLTATTEETT